MYGNGHTGNVALRVTDVRSGDIPSLTAWIVVSLNSLIFTLKKYAESLAVTIICILSLSLSHTPRVKIQITG